MGMSKVMTDKENITGRPEGALYQALAQAQAAIPPVAKDARNDHFKSSYATLGAVMDACRGPLRDAGLLLVQEPCCVMDGQGAMLRLTTRIIHAASGEQLVNMLDLPLARLDAQAAGSAITYARRYALTSLLAMTVEDDDGNGACRGNGPQRAARPGRNGGADQEAGQRIWEEFQNILERDFRGDSAKFGADVSSFFGRRISGSADLTLDDMARYVSACRARQRDARG